MDNSYIALLPLVSSVPIIILGVFAYLKNRKSTLNILFFLFSLAIFTWLIGSYGLFTSCDNYSRAIFWDRFVYSSVVFLSAIGFHITSVFSGKQRKQTLLITGLYAVSLIFFVANWQGGLIDGIFLYKWGCHGVAKSLHSVFLLYFGLGCVLLFRNLFNYYKTTESKTEKAQAKYMFVSLFVLAILGSTAFLPAYRIVIYPLGYLAGVLSAVILAYAVFKHHLFDIRVISTEVFSFLILTVLFVDIFLYRNAEEFIFKLVIFLGIAVFSRYLIKSALKEMKDKERIENLALSLEKANAGLRKIDETKSEFVSTASHQLRTPLSIMKGFLSMLLEESYGEIGGKQRQALEKTYETNERLIHLVNELLDVSRIEKNKVQLFFSYCNFTETAKSVFDEFIVVAKNKGIMLSFEKLDEDIYVYCDAEKIREVIQNLIDNAIKYTDSGGVIMNLEKIESEGIAVLRIIDTGIGIKEEGLDNLFKMFYRDKGAQKIMTSGSGLGLYIARKIAQANNGSLVAESAGEGLGSTFTLRIPLGQKEKQEIPAEE